MSLALLFLFTLSLSSFLYQNQFSSTLPTELASLTALKQLCDGSACTGCAQAFCRRLYVNRFEGSFPAPSMKRIHVYDALY